MEVYYLRSPPIRTPNTETIENVSTVVLYEAAAEGLMINWYDKLCSDSLKRLPQFSMAFLALFGANSVVYFNLLSSTLYG